MVPARPAPIASDARAGSAPTVATLPSAPVSPHVHTLPPELSDVDLSVMPDRYVNEPLPASFRLVVSVRGIPAIASVDPPSTITWTEGGLSYRLTSPGLTLLQLLDIASALR